VVKIIPNDPYGNRLVFDLDGTLNQFIGWTGKYEIYPPLKGSEQCLQELIAEGWDLILATARPDIEEAVKPWLKEIGWDKYFIEVWQKPFGMAYIDDKNIYFDGNYKHLKRDLRKLESWYAKKPSILKVFVSKFREFVLEFLKMLNNLYEFPEDSYFEDLGF